MTFISTSNFHYRELHRKENHNDLNRAAVEAINGIVGVTWPEKLGGDRISRPRGVVVLADVIDDGNPEPRNLTGTVG